MDNKLIQKKTLKFCYDIPAAAAYCFGGVGGVVAMPLIHMYIATGSFQFNASRHSFRRPSSSLVTMVFLKKSSYLVAMVFLKKWS